MHPVDLKTEINKMGKVFKAFENFELVVDAVVGLNEQKSLLVKEIDTLKAERDEVAKGLKKEKDRLAKETEKSVSVEEDAKAAGAQIINDAQDFANKVLADVDGQKEKVLVDVKKLEAQKEKTQAELDAKVAELKDVTDKFDKLKAKISAIVEV